MGKIIHTDKAPKAIGPYSQALVTDKLVFTSGQIPINPTTEKIEVSTIIEQTHQVCKNISAILEKAGSSLNKVVKTTCYLSEISNFSEFNQVYSEYFTSKPARSCVAVKDLPKGALVEIDVIAEIE